MASPVQRRPLSGDLENNEIKIAPSMDWASRPETDGLVTYQVIPYVFWLGMGILNIAFPYAEYLIGLLYTRLLGKTYYYSRIFADPLFCQHSFHISGEKDSRTRPLVLPCLTLKANNLSLTCSPYQGSSLQTEVSYPHIV